MTRHIRGWYGLADCNGSHQEWTEELPDDWDSYDAEEQQSYLAEAADVHLYNVLDHGAELVEGGES